MLKKPKNIVMSRNWNAGRDDSVKVDNSSIESEEQLKYLEKTLTDESSIQE
jgi:hypothetical protein